MKTTARDWIALVGRLLMSAVFIHGGVGQALAPTATMAMLARQGLPMLGATYALTLLIQLGASSLFLVGFKARLMALILAAWCIATAMVAHYHPEVREQVINFYKNVCMAGGLLQIVAFGPGRLSVDRG